MTAIYIVDIDDGNRVSRVTRRILLAESAEEAAEIAARAQWPALAPAYTRPIGGPAPDDRIRVGRIGEYEPGIEGAALARKTGDILATD